MELESQNYQDILQPKKQGLYMDNIAVPSFAGRLDKTSEAVVSPHETITKEAATSQRSDNRGKHATRVQGPGIVEDTTTMRRLPTVRRLRVTDRISRRMNSNTPVECRPGALSIKGRAPGTAPEWLQRLRNNNSRKRSSTQGTRTSAIECEAFAIRQSLVVPGYYHVVLPSSVTTPVLKRHGASSGVPTDDQSHLPPGEMRKISSMDQSHLPPEMRSIVSPQELRTIEEQESNIPDEDIDMSKFRANIVPNRRISKLPTAEVAPVSGEVSQLISESQVIAIRDPSNYEVDDLSESRSCMDDLCRLVLGFKKKKKQQPDADRE